MRTVQEARAETKREAGMQAMAPTGADAIMYAADEYALAVHVAACRDTSGNGYSDPWSYCGDDFQTSRRGARIDLDTIWYCDEALAIKRDREGGRG